MQNLCNGTSAGQRANAEHSTVVLTDTPKKLTPRLIIVVLNEYIFNSRFQIRLSVLALSFRATQIKHLLNMSVEENESREDKWADHTFLCTS